MVGRAKIEESKSNIALNVWQPRTSYSMCFVLSFDVVPFAFALYFCLPLDCLFCMPLILLS